VATASTFPANLVFHLFDATANAANAAAASNDDSRDDSSSNSHHRFAHTGHAGPAHLFLSFCVLLRNCLDFDAELPLDFFLGCVVDVDFGQSAVGQGVVEVQVGDRPIGQVNLLHQIVQRFLSRVGGGAGGDVGAASGIGEEVVRQVRSGVACDRLVGGGRRGDRLSCGGS